MKEKKMLAKHFFFATSQIKFVFHLIKFIKKSSIKIKKRVKLY